MPADPTRTEQQAREGVDADEREVMANLIAGTPAHEDDRGPENTVIGDHVPHLKGEKQWEMPGPIMWAVDRLRSQGFSRDFTSTNGETKQQLQADLREILRGMKEASIVPDEGETLGAAIARASLASSAHHRAVAEGLVGALTRTRTLVAECAASGFTEAKPLERLFFNQQALSSALAALAKGEGG